MPSSSQGRASGITNGMPLAGRYTPPGAVMILPPRAPMPAQPSTAAPPGLPRASVFTQGPSGWNLSHQLTDAPAESLQGLSIDDALSNFGQRYSGGPTQGPIANGPTPAPTPVTNAPPMMPTAPRLADARNWSVR